MGDKAYWKRLVGGGLVGAVLISGGAWRSAAEGLPEPLHMMLFQGVAAGAIAGLIMHLLAPDDGRSEALFSHYKRWVVSASAGAAGLAVPEAFVRHNWSDIPGTIALGALIGLGLAHFASFFRDAAKSPP